MKILIVSDSAESSSGIRTTIECHLKHKIFEVFSRGDMKKQLECAVFNLLIIDSIYLDARMLEKISWLKSAGCIFPIMCISEKAQNGYLHKLKNIEGVHILQRPFYDKNIVGLVNKLLAVREVPKQIFRRYNTNQIVQIEAMQSGENIMTCMYNLSQGGAYVEFEKGTSIGIGDLYRVRVNIENSNQYSFNAKVIWTTPSGRFSGRFGCGLKFISTKETHHTMLMKT